MDIPIYLLLLFFVVAFIYSSVGHGGASGYIAILTLTGLFSPQFVPVVLVLNILVSGTAFYNYGSRGHFRWPLFWPFALGSIPAAFAGGYIELEIQAFYVLVGIVLIVMAGFIILKTFLKEVKDEFKPVNTLLAIVLGVVIGLLSGLIGVGGGIFLSPLILLLGWADMRRIAAVSALFILVNSGSGLLGHLFSTQIMWEKVLMLMIPVFIGGFLGSHFGVKSINPSHIRIMLAVVLIIAGGKMLLQ